MARDRKRKKPRRPADGGATPAPEPLEGATPYVDEAQMAEAGADVPAPAEDESADNVVFEDEREVEAAPDRLENDTAPVRAGSEHLISGAPSERTRKGRGGRFITFLGHCVDELRRVQWPNRRHVGQATAVVLGFVVIAGGYLGLLDALWQPLIEAIL